MSTEHNKSRRLLIVLFAVVMALFLSIFAMDLDCLAGGCHHDADCEGLCHTERNLLAGSTTHTPGMPPLLSISGAVPASSHQEGKEEAIASDTFTGAMAPLLNLQLLRAPPSGTVLF